MSRLVEVLMGECRVVLCSTAGGEGGLSFLLCQSGSAQLACSLSAQLNRFLLWMQ